MNKKGEMENKENTTPETAKADEATKTNGKEQPKAEETEKAGTADSGNSAAEAEENKGTENKTEAGQQAEAEEPAQPQPQPQENAIPLSEVVTRSELDALLNEKLAPIMAKNRALEQENEQLKNSLDEAEKKASDLHDKYEVGDFGAPQKKGDGLGGSDAKGNANYTSYEDIWAGKTEFDK